MFSQASKSLYSASDKLFPDDPSDLLSIFVDSKNGADQNLSNPNAQENNSLKNSQKTSLKEGFQTLGYGASTNSKSSEQSHHQIFISKKDKPRPKAVFQLNYLPKQITEEEILEKISKFGKIVNFSLWFPGFSPEEKKIGEKKTGSFRFAEFSFENFEDELIFMKVKRIRIKGLQIKISYELSGHSGSHGLSYFNY